MKIGTGTDATTIDGLIDQVRAAREHGMANVWASHIFGFDAMTALAIAGREVPDIEFGTSVVPVYTRHPTAMAQQALTTAAATGNRFVLGIGLSHQFVVENMWGISFDKPVRYMREYVTIVRDLLHTGTAKFNGEVFRVNATLEQFADPPQIIIAALGPAMLKLAGELAEGTTTWMTGPATLADHIVPTIVRAAEAAGRPAPRIVSALPVCVSTDIEGSRERAAKSFAIYGSLPSYRAMLDREGAAGPGDVAIVGDEEAVRAQIQRVVDAGVTDFLYAPFGGRADRERTIALIVDIAKNLHN